MDGMSNEQITAEFEALFGGTESEVEDSVESEVEATETETEDTDVEESETEQTEETTEDSEDSSEEGQSEKSTQVEDKRQSKQNYAFAQQRQQLKARENLIKDLGKLVGMEGSSVDDIADKIKESLLKKQAKEQNVSVDLLRRLERAEAIIQDNEKLKLERDVQNAFADLIEEHDLSKEQIDEFTQYLIANDKNPMEGKEVDLKAEYLKLHWKDMLASEVTKAVEKEKARQEKVAKKAGSKADGTGSRSSSDEKITSVKALDDLFNGMDL